MYGTAFNQINEVYKLSKSTNNVSIGFLIIYLDFLRDPYLRRLKKEDLKQTLVIMNIIGFPECMSSWVCQRWEWKSCPVFWAGLLKGR